MVQFHAFLHSGLGHFHKQGISTGFAPLKSSTTGPYSSSNPSLTHQTNAEASEQQMARVSGVPRGSVVCRVNMTGGGGRGAPAPLTTASGSTPPVSDTGDVGRGSILHSQLLLQWAQSHGFEKYN